MCGFILVEPNIVDAQTSLGLLNTMWQSQNKQAKDLYDKKEYQRSYELFTNLAWRANALYNAGLYEEALILFRELDQYYNQGNTLVKLGRYKEAINQYEQVDKDYINYQDVQYNLALIKNLLEENNQRSGKDDQQKKNDQQSGEGNQQKINDQQSGKDDQQKKDAQQQDNTIKDKQLDQEKLKGGWQDKQNKLTKNNNLTVKEKVRLNQDIDRKNQANKQKLEQIFKEIQTQPIGLLKQKFLIERYNRQKKLPYLINTNKTQSW